MKEKILIGSFLVLFMSCSKNDDPSMGNNVNCFPTEIVKKRTEPAAPSDNSHTIHTLILNSDNKPISEKVEDLLNSSKTYQIKYSYDNLGRMVAIDKDYPTGIDTRNDIIYSGDLITEIKYQNVTASKYTYNASKQLIESQQYVIFCSTSGCSSGQPYSTIYEYENEKSKNPKILRASTNGWAEITYDNKKGIWNQLSYETVSPYYNNPTKLVIKDGSGKITSTVSITYEYNQQEYPTKMILNDEEATSEYTLNYNCEL